MNKAVVQICSLRWLFLLLHNRMSAYEFSTHTLYGRLNYQIWAGLWHIETYKIVLTVIS
jgi:hypothetical protein